MNILLLILVPVVLLFACALGMMWVPLPRFFPLPLSQGRNLMAAITTGVLGIGYVTALTGYVISMFLQAGRVLDGVCASLGLTPQSYLIFGRRYHGSIRGRQVDTDFLPPRGFSPGIINIYVRADLGARIAIGQRKPLLDCRGCPRLSLDEPGLGDLQILAQEEMKARRLLADPMVRAALGRLMAGQESPGLGGTFRELYVQPDTIWFRSHPRQVTEARFRQCLDDLLSLAEAAEEMVKP